MKPPENENGGFSAAAIALAPAKEPDALGEGVNAVQMARWLDEAIATCRRAASDPVEFQRLGIWLARIRRALP